MQVIDATGMVMGRLASHVAKRLLEGDEIQIVNAEKSIVTGKREMVLNEHYARQKLNHPRKGPNYPRQPHWILKRAVRGMIPYQTPRGRAAFKRLRVDIGVPAKVGGIEAERPAKAQHHGRGYFIELAEISRRLGAKF